MSSDPPNAVQSNPPRRQPEDSTFDCNVCFDTPRDPVVTPCGHLYCWPCLYTWMTHHLDSPQCPVCKAGVDKKSVIPIYGRGRSEVDPRDKTAEIPPRPQGQRLPPMRGIGGFGVIHQQLSRYGGYDNLSLSTFGSFPSLFGMQIAYPHMNEMPREEPRENQEEGMGEMIARVFFLLAMFIAIIIATF